MGTTVGLEPAPNARTPWWRHIFLDYRRYRATRESPLTVIFMTQGFWAGCVYRLSHAAVMATPLGLPRRLVRMAAGVAQKAMEVIAGISIPAECRIGEGLYIGHFGSIILPRSGRIGRNCNIGQNVTIGRVDRKEMRGAPVIGDRVFIGPHSVILGKITLGHDAFICAGSVVTRDVPPRAVVMGNPARVVSYEGSFDKVHYDAMEQDPERIAALQSEPVPRPARPAAVG